ncbi:efflux RND transporter periplasmic adaptor subunit [Sphingomonas crusticola]|uniref:efflux RND transporter periplasmic adaptor subunit n=1 Tax=Sphingomonas crusticola TaxID=1697973 RepID=UPI000E2708C7|nr:efflux RND transporter periplasmic adaptor subunit [Sphingomonas crusticola]
MSVVRIQSEANSATLATGMDRVIARRKLPRWALVAAGAVILLLLALAWWLAPHGNRQTVPADRLTISEVRNGTFDDFLPLRSLVTPLLTVYLDAVEGGRVEKKVVEDGAFVEKGQLLAVMSNADLQLATLRSETDVAQQLNNLRVTELSLSQTLSENERAVTQAENELAKAKRLYDLQQPLAQRGFVAAKVFGDTKDDLVFQQKKLREVRAAQSTQGRLQSSQLTQLRATARSLQAALGIARGNLDQLNLRAPVSGQLSSFAIEVGESMSRGERIGQIDSPGRNKLRAQVDEFYLGRVQPGQVATVDYAGKTYRLKVAKIFPQVKNGIFEADLWFVGPEPQGIQRGQTLQAKLTFGDPAPARLLPNGAFYNDTGGQWVFVVAPGGGSAVKRQVRLGRRNTDFIEVLDGLEPGEKVVTSPYTGFADKDRLDISQ